MRRPTALDAPRSATAACVFCALLAPGAAADETALRQLRIESEPPGAEVLLIGGSAGRTPLSVGERAIYPNDYSDEQAPLYGLVTLRREGCATHVQRVTLDDIEHGMRVRLDCDPALATGAGGGTDAGAAQAPESESASRRRLRQLQVLQELLDEGLISAAEEQRIRRALLRAP